LYVDYVEDYFRKRVYIMAFGKRASAPVTNYTDENGGSGKSVFFPTASGEKGATVTHVFRLLPDTEDREESEIVVTEWRGKVKVNGRDTWRSCLVRRDNPNDTAIWEQINEIKEREGLSDEDKAELARDLRKGLAKRVFLINVFNPDIGAMQVFKGTWEDHVFDEVSGTNKPKNPNGGKSIYAKMLSKIQTGAHIQDPKNKLKRIVINDPAQFDMLFTISGEGLRKNYDFSPGAVSPLEPEVLQLPRYKLAEWASEGVGIWPNEALSEVLAGADYYEVQKKYGVVLYPELEEVEEPVTVTADAAVDDDDGDPLFSD
jgi:hypothetical protein